MKMLQDAQKLSISGDYLGALSILRSLLKQNPYDVEVLRLHGNIIELMAFDRELNGGAKFVNSPEMLKARACYEQALLLNPAHAGVLVDLGTHWKNVGDSFKASQFLDKVIGMLIDLPKLGEKHDYLIEALGGKIEILQDRGDVAEAQLLQTKLDLLQQIGGV